MLLLSRTATVSKLGQLGLALLDARLYILYQPSETFLYLILKDIAQADVEGA